ncbi:hypothetical protein LTR36_007919 [Oleoguttula mirabilis]|uniref:Uncharacterized protein n=1 Tax=Oleoguttula mirabilis TaxID=1507867 RepID=A0AAV9J954_9PEZI|nr:hypothetical protein LTR36_007919 [Oleoguttula mirabilis]
MHSTDAAHNPALRAHFITLLDTTEPPGSFKASEVALLLTPKELFVLGYENATEAMPAIIELAFELREFGDCDILKKGKVLGEDVTAFDIEGGVRIRRRGMRFDDGDRMAEYLE